MERISWLDQEISIVRARIIALRLRIKDLKRELEWAKAWLMAAGGKRQFMMGYRQHLSEIARQLVTLSQQMDAEVRWVVDSLVKDFVAEHHWTASSMQMQRVETCDLHYVIILKGDAPIEQQKFKEFFSAFQLFDEWGNVLIRFDLTTEPLAVDVAYMEVKSG